MRRLALVLVLGLTASSGLAWAQGDGPPPAPNAIELPQGYKDWRVIASSHRSDHGSLRVILGNDAAVEAAREGKTAPWPDGAILAKLVWFDRTDENWEAATVPGEFVHAEFMIKDSRKYAETGGWGYARWLGLDRKPYGEDADFSQECLACHTPVASRDYVFTTPATLPYPQAQTFLMDRSTLLAHRTLWGVEPSPYKSELTRLRDNERALYDDLHSDRLGHRVRLEQERVRFGWLKQALKEITPSPADEDRQPTIAPKTSEDGG